MSKSTTVILNRVVGQLEEKREEGIVYGAKSGQRWQKVDKLYKAVIMSIVITMERGDIGFCPYEVSFRIYRSLITSSR